jgi:micrococcal nuclease
VYDGDTLRLTIDLGFGFARKRLQLRLARINTPELRGKEREKGLEVRDALRKKLEGSELVVQTFRDRTGKYGRYLVELWILEGGVPLNVNDWLLENGYATRWSG